MVKPLLVNTCNSTHCQHLHSDKRKVHHGGRRDIATFPLLYSGSSHGYVNSTVYHYSKLHYLSMFSRFHLLLPEYQNKWRKTQWVMPTEIKTCTIWKKCAELPGSRLHLITAEREEQNRKALLDVPANCLYICLRGHGVRRLKGS